MQWPTVSALMRLALPVHCLLRAQPQACAGSTKCMFSGLGRDDCASTPSSLWALTGLPWEAAFSGCWGAHATPVRLQSSWPEVPHITLLSTRRGQIITDYNSLFLDSDTDRVFQVFSKHSYNIHISSGSIPDRKMILGREEVVLMSNNPLCHQ